MIRVLGDAWQGFVRHDCPGMAAGLAFYTLFSLAPLLVIVVQVVAWVVDPATFSEFLVRQADTLIGAAGAEQVRTILAAAGRARVGSPWASVAGTAIAVLGATTVLVQLQTALNRVWGVQPAPGPETIRQFVIKRIISIAMLAILAFLLVVSLVVSATVAAASTWVGGFLPEALRARASGTVDLLVSFAVFGAVFSATFKFLPDAVLRWRHVIGGGCVTAALFVIGKSLIGWYMGSSALASLYGAAGSLAVVLVWVYYNAILVLFGAELTRAWAAWLGERVAPECFAEPAPEPSSSAPEPSPA